MNRKEFLKHLGLGIFSVVGLSAVINTLNGGKVSAEVSPDATTTSKGIVKLAGDLSGTADTPTVPRLNTVDTRLQAVENRDKLAQLPFDFQTNGTTYFTAPFNATFTGVSTINGTGSSAAAMTYKVNGVAKTTFPFSVNTGQELAVAVGGMPTDQRVSFTMTISYEL